jgi:exodeoxyribonuclease V gamma subunit
MTHETRRPKAIQVWYSNQLEVLADCLMVNLGEANSSPTDRLFNMPTIIVPNPNIATYLKYEIAQGVGIAAGLKFTMTEQFFDDLLRRVKVQPPSKLVRGGPLRAFLIDVLSDGPDAVSPLPHTVLAYLAAGGDDEDARDLRRFQLGSRLAGLARQYGNYRPEWLKAWANGEATLATSPMAETERWQRAIWAQLIERVRAQEIRGTKWVLPLELFDYLGRAEIEPIQQIHLFGFSYLWHGLRDMITHLGERSIVHIYTLAPFVEFPEDLSSLTAKVNVASRSPQRGKGVLRTPNGEDTKSLDEFSIVTQWGRPGREYFEMLAEMPGVAFGPKFVSIDHKTVLARLQREILRRSPESDSPMERDHSLTIVASPAIRREAEFIANEIWRLIRESDRREASKAGQLRFRDIAVLLADSVNRPLYQAHLRAVFEELHGIPYNMLDVPLAGECRVIEALLLLLALPMGEFTRPEVLKILTHHAVRARFAEADVDRWRDWCIELEIVRGADRIDHDGTYIDRELFHWEQGLKRLVLGAFMTGPQSGDDRVYELGDAEYLPYDQSSDALADVGRLLVLMRSLVADARFAVSARLTMTEWAVFFARMVDAYLAADSDPEERALSQCLQKIEQLRGLDVTGRKVGYRIAYESLREGLLELTGSRGHYLAHGVVVSPLLEMRSLPFRVVFLCGLGERQFPAVDGSNPLDLTLLNRQPGDVSRRERDKYLLLETLVCARERLYLSYVARDAQTGDKKAPATVIHELMRYLHQGRAGDPLDYWVQNQPLRRFDDAYFSTPPVARSKASALANFSSSARQEWQARELRESLRNHCNGMPRLSPDSLRGLDHSLVTWLGLCPIVGGRDDPSQRLAVSFRDLLAFLKCPLQGWAKLMLRLRQDNDDEDAVREDEPFVMERLGETNLLREVFFDVLGHADQTPNTGDFERLYALHAESRVRRGLIPIGLFGEAERQRHLAYLTGWSESARRRDLVGRSHFQVYRFGRASEAERVDRLECPIAVDVPMRPGFPPVRVELHGRTELVVTELPASITPVVKDTPTEKDFLAGFLDAVVLSLLPGQCAVDIHHAHVIPGGDTTDLAKSHREFRGIDQVKAREFLTNLLADLLGGSHAYLLPCEAVFDYLSRKRSIESSVEEMKENDNKACSSRYGPVPNFEDYDPPDRDEAQRIIDRRFGLFVESGGLGA